MRCRRRSLCLRSLLNRARSPLRSDIRPPVSHRVHHATVIYEDDNHIGRGAMCNSRHRCTHGRGAYRPRAAANRWLSQRALNSNEGEAMAPLNGTVKRLVSNKGFGFILSSDGNEYFFHNSACMQVAFDDLREG